MSLILWMVQKKKLHILSVCSYTMVLLFFIIYYIKKMSMVCFTLIHCRKTAFIFMEYFWWFEILHQTSKSFLNFQSVQYIQLLYTTIILDPEFLISFHMYVHYWLQKLLNTKYYQKCNLYNTATCTTVSLQLFFCVTCIITTQTKNTVALKT
jgi:hypothetical protein